MSDILMRPLVRLQVALADLREREDGQTTTEYAILLGFLAIAIIVALFFLRNVLRDLFSEAASSVDDAELRAVPAVRATDGLAEVCAGPVTPSTGPERSQRLSAAELRMPTKGESEGLVGTHPSAGCRNAAHMRNLSVPNEVRRARQSHAGAVWPL